MVYAERGLKWIRTQNTLAFTKRPREASFWPGVSHRKDKINKISECSPSLEIPGLSSTPAAADLDGAAGQWGR